MNYTLIIKRYELQGNTIHSHIIYKHHNDVLYFAGIEKKGSEIPTGNYKANFTFSPKFNTYLYLIDVPQRQGIRIHWGNSYKDTTGCILIGQYRNNNKILLSKNSVNLLHAASGKYKLNIIITNEKNHSKSTRKCFKEILGHCIKWLRKNAKRRFRR